jgi:hypothetical protein
MTKSVAPPFRACPDPAAAGDGAARAGLKPSGRFVADRFAEANRGTSRAKCLQVRPAQQKCRHYRFLPS